MPITLPNLDDRRYADLVEEARALIPTYAPEWTDHNESDPGITLIELFAYLSEMLIYRLNRVTDANRYAFLKLLDPEFKPSPTLSLEEQTRAVVLSLRQADRAVTCADFEKLALEGSARQNPSKADGYAARVRCVPRRNLEVVDATARNSDQPNHTSVVVVPFGPAQQPTQRLRDVVKEYLGPLRLVTTVVHVVGPRYVKVLVQVTVVLTPDTAASQAAAVRAPLEAALAAFLHPLTGGPDGKGWPFGRNVYVSEIYDILDRQRSVDYVRRTEVPKQGGGTTPIDELSVAEPARLRRNAAGGLVSVEIRDDELVSAQFDLKLEFPSSCAAPRGPEENRWQTTSRRPRARARARCSTTCPRFTRTTTSSAATWRPSRRFCCATQTAAAVSKRR